MNNSDIKILVVDDEEIVRDSLAGWFEEDGYYSIEWKNVYSLNGPDVSRDDFKLTITKEVAGTTKTEEVDSTGVSYPYLRWYEVEDDQTNDLVDINWLNPAYGEFKLFILLYFIKAKESYPMVYQSMLNNKPLIEAFLKI